MYVWISKRSSVLFWLIVGLKLLMAWLRKSVCSLWFWYGFCLRWFAPVYLTKCVYYTLLCGGGALFFMRVGGGLCLEAPAIITLLSIIHVLLLHTEFVHICRKTCTKHLPLPPLSAPELSWFSWWSWCWLRMLFIVFLKVDFNESSNGSLVWS